MLVATAAVALVWLILVAVLWLLIQYSQAPDPTEQNDETLQSLAIQSREHHQHGAGKSTF